MEIKEKEMISKIKAAQITARKAKDAIRSTLLTTLIGEAEMVGKSAGNRASTDAEVLTVLKKFEKGMVENIAIYTKNDMRERLQLAEQEITIIREFLPQKLSDDQVMADIIAIMREQNLSAEQKSMGAVTKALKPKYGDQFDGGQISTVFKKLYL
jgi:uncharacterized protein YqeY